MRRTLLWLCASTARAAARKQHVYLPYLPTYLPAFVLSSTISCVYLLLLLLPLKSTCYRRSLLRPPFAIATQYNTHSPFVGNQNNRTILILFFLSFLFFITTSDTMLGCVEEMTMSDVYCGIGGGGGGGGDATCTSRDPLDMLKNESLGKVVVQSCVWTGKTMRARSAK
jgi:hypothetical protein